MVKRDAVKLRNMAVELDELTARIEEALASNPSPHYTLVADGSNLTAITLFPSGAKDVSDSVTMTDFGKHTQSPACAALAFRMAVIRLSEPDSANRPPAFADMLPDVIGELCFLEQFILMTFAQEIDLSVGVEMASDCSGLVNTLLLTTSTTGNTYRTKVASCSQALRSDIRNFDLFDGVRYGSVLVMQ